MTSSRDTVREALVALGATENKLFDKRWRLPKVRTEVHAELRARLYQATFIHECKEYLREKGKTHFHIGDSGSSFGVSAYVAGDPSSFTDASARTEPEAWAKAVLSASEGEG